MTKKFVIEKTYVKAKKARTGHNGKETKKSPSVPFLLSVSLAHPSLAVIGVIYNVHAVFRFACV